MDQVTIRRRAVGLIARDAARSAGGYTLYAPQTGGGAVYLVDAEGREAHRWQLGYRPGRDAVILPNGNLGYNGSHPDSKGGYPAWPLWRGGIFQEVTADGKVVWEHQDLTHHHDAQWLANGNILYGACERMPDEAARKVAGGFTPRDLPGGAIYGDVVREIDRSGRLVWEWRSWEHLDFAAFLIHPIFDRHHWPFINGVNVTRDDLVLMSLRVTSGIIAVDRKSGKIVWTIGPDILAQQHAPFELDNGNILAFDNGNLRPGVTSPHSRVVEVEPRTGKVAWQYADPMRPAFFSPYMGSAERLWNGNTFVCESTFGRLFEVTPDGDIVWEFVVPQFGEYPDDGARAFAVGLHNSVFRAHRYRKEQMPWL